MNLVQTLLPGPLDIVGDIHGEYQALLDLLSHLGYDRNGDHPDGRHLVFVGDLFDRGPQSPEVFEMLAPLQKQGKIQVILGNHELNVIRHQPKDGTGWYFDERVATDNPKYGPFSQASDAQHKLMPKWLDTLPIALERDDLRVVHAAWLESKINLFRNEPVGTLRQLYNKWQKYADDKKAQPEFQARLRAEREIWPHDIEDLSHVPPVSPAHAEAQMLKQMTNPVNTILAGAERPSAKPFYASGKWRFCERVRWWEEYTDTTPVIMGHYWRRFDPETVRIIEQRNEDVFAGLNPFQWHGQHNNVFCLDYSVGGRWMERKMGLEKGAVFKLGAMRWPEKTLYFDDGQVIETTNQPDDTHKHD